MEDVEKTGHDCPPITSQHHDPDRNSASPRTDSRITRITSNISQAASRTKRPKDILQKEKYPEQELEKGIVGWEGQDDPQNPRYVLLLAMHGFSLADLFQETIPQFENGPSWGSSALSHSSVHWRPPCLHLLSGSWTKSLGTHQQS
jgi:hypothetical protein